MTRNSFERLHVIRSLLYRIGSTPSLFNFPDPKVTTLKYNQGQGCYILLHQSKTTGPHFARAQLQINPPHPEKCISVSLFTPRRSLHWTRQVGNQRWPFQRTRRSTGSDIIRLVPNNVTQQNTGTGNTHWSFGWGCQRYGRR